MATLFLTGGRSKEVIMLKKDNFDFNEEEAIKSNAFLVRKMDVLKRTRKGKPIGTTRTFPIWNDDPLVKYLKNWLDKTEGHLFTTKNGIMERGNAFKVVREAGKLLDRPLHINTMWFRKQRQYYLIQVKGFSVYDVQTCLKLRIVPKIFRTT